MDSNLSYVNNFFLQKHICLNDEWLEAVLSMLKQQQYQILSQDHLTKAVFEQWIYSDISQSTHPSFQLPDQNAKKIDGVFILQITSVYDIGSSLYSQYRAATDKADNFDFFDALPKEEQPKEMQFKEKANRMLLFELSDGNTTVKAIEYRPIPTILSSIMPGAKILLHGSIQKRQDILWLTASNCQLLGGDLDTLCQANQKESFLGKKLNIEKYKNVASNPQINPPPLSSSSASKVAVQNIPVVENVENIPPPTTSTKNTVPRKPKIVPEVITLSPCKPVATVQPIVQRNRQSATGSSSNRGSIDTSQTEKNTSNISSSNVEQTADAGPKSRSRQSVSSSRSCKGPTFNFPDSPETSQTEINILSSTSEPLQPATAPKSRNSTKRGPSFRFPDSPENSHAEDNASNIPSNNSTSVHPCSNTIPKPRNRQSASTRKPTFRFPESPDKDISNASSSNNSEPVQPNTNTVPKPKTRTSSNRGSSFRFPDSPEPSQAETQPSNASHVEPNLPNHSRPNHSRRPPPIVLETPTKAEIKMEEVVPGTPEDNQPIIPTLAAVPPKNQQSAKSNFLFPDDIENLLEEKPIIEATALSKMVQQRRPVKIEIPNDDEDIVILEISPLLLQSAASPKREIKEEEVVPGTPEDNQPIIPPLQQQRRSQIDNCARKLLLDYSSTEIHTPIDKRMSQVEISENVPPPSPSRFSKSVQKRPLKIEIRDSDEDIVIEESLNPPRNSSSFKLDSSPEAKKSKIIDDPSPSQSRLITKYKELKLLKIAKAINLMKFSVGSKKLKITAYTVEILEPFSMEDGEWTMKIRLKDETCDNLDCSLSHQLLCKLVGMTPDEAVAIKKSSNFAKRREGTERIRNLDAQLERLDLIFEIEFFAANRATPRIIEMETFTDALI